MRSGMNRESYNEQESIGSGNRSDSGRIRRRTAAFLVAVLFAATCFADTPAALQLTLPLAMYAVPGVEMNIYFDNVVLTETPEAYRFQVTCEHRSSEREDDGRCFRRRPTQAISADGDRKRFLRRGTGTRLNRTERSFRPMRGPENRFGY